jgi:hypothetical protein
LSERAVLRYGARRGRRVPLRVLWSAGRRGIAKDLARPLEAPLRARFAMWRRGFKSEAMHFKDFDRHGIRDYLPSIRNNIADYLVDRPSRHLIRNKLVFHSIMARWPGATPALYAIIDRGTVRCDPALVDGLLQVGLSAICRLRGALFLKPVRGVGGGGSYVVEQGESGYRLDGVPCSEAALDAMAARCKQYLVSERIEQAEYASRIYPGAVATMRIVTLRDPDVGEVFIAGAVHRFGSKLSGHVDNWSQAGLCAAVDLDGGRLGPAATPPDYGPVVWHARHPETGAAIEGAVVPQWDRIKDRVLEWATGFPFVDFMGWDVALDSSGAVRAIEANSRPDMSLFQVRAPILTDPRVRRFFEAHGVVR